MNDCPVCREPAGNNANTIFFSDNNRGHFDCIKVYLDIIGVTKDDLKNYHPVNVSYFFRDSVRIFSFIYEKLKKDLDQISADDLKSYQDTSPKIMDITYKFLALEEICLSCGLSYEEKVSKFLFYNEKNNEQASLLSNKKLYDLSVKIDFFAVKTGVFIKRSNSALYTPSTGCTIKRTGIQV